MTGFFEMGGYAGYVWPAYAATVVVLVGLWLASLRGARLREAQLKLLQQSRPHRRRTASQRMRPEEATGADA